VQAPAKVSSGTRKGWLGGFEESNLSKWYGPDRVLYLPGGLLDRSDLPDYLDGTLAGE
jgi:light-harvesting complex II chlorophyll a/b binding protein 5